MAIQLQTLRQGTVGCGTICSLLLCSSLSRLPAGACCCNSLLNLASLPSSGCDGQPLCKQARQHPQGCCGRVHANGSTAMLSSGTHAACRRYKLARLLSDPHLETQVSRLQHWLATRAAPVAPVAQGPAPAAAGTAPAAAGRGGMLWGGSAERGSKTWRKQTSACVEAAVGLAAEQPVHVWGWQGTPRPWGSPACHPSRMHLQHAKPAHHLPPAPPGS